MQAQEQFQPSYLPHTMMMQSLVQYSQQALGTILAEYCGRPLMGFENISLSAHLADMLDEAEKTLSLDGTFPVMDTILGDVTQLFLTHVSDRLTLHCGSQSLYADLHAVHLNQMQLDASLEVESYYKDKIMCDPDTLEELSNALCAIFARYSDRILSDLCGLLPFCQGAIRHLGRSSVRH